MVDLINMINRFPKDGNGERVYFPRIDKTKKEIKMALEVLKGLSEIGGFKICRGTDYSGRPSKNGTPGTFVAIDDDFNSIHFKIQNGPIKEKGVNGCQVDTVIHAALLILAGLNKKYPCRENACAITKLDEALMWLEKRTKDRECRCVEGTNKA